MITSSLKHVSEHFLEIKLLNCNSLCTDQKDDFNLISAWPVVDYRVITFSYSESDVRCNPVQFVWNERRVTKPYGKFRCVFVSHCMII